MSENDDDFKQKLAAARAALREISPEPTESLRQYILALRPEIRAKRAADTKWPIIAEALKSVGIDIKPETLRAYANGKGVPSKAARSVAEKSRKVTPARPVPDPPPDNHSSPSTTDPCQGETEATADGNPVKARRMK